MKGFMKNNQNHKDKLIIIGASGHGRVVADIAIRMNQWNKIAFLDDDESIKSSMNIDVIGKSDDTLKYIDDFDIFVAIGDNKTREAVQNRIQVEGASIPVLIHPSAVIGYQVEIGRGTVIIAGAIINCCTKIGEGCIINTGATIDHDNVIGDFVHISPGAHTAGAVNIGKRTWLGIGSIVTNNICITDDSIIGAGAVVLKDISKKGIYFGVPAQKFTIQKGKQLK